ncbi:MAG TPA: DUF4111 domain-containing protein [Pyrinomonadaceae bacterium]
MDIKSHQIPEAVVEVLNRHVVILIEVLGRDLTGVYLHGSAAIGGFSFQQSDIDYVALIADPLRPSERQRLAQGFLGGYGDGVPAKGVEMSIVLERFAGPGFRYPTPYEFHLGTEEQIRQHASPHKEEMVDPDLAAHFTIIKQRGICIYGKPVDEVFDDVPREFYLDAIIADAEENFRNIHSKTDDSPCRVPMYAVLNFCRVLAYIDDGLIASKLEGAEWGLSQIPSEYQAVIFAAKSEYANSRESHLVSGTLLKQFASYARGRYMEATETC